MSLEARQQNHPTESFKSIISDEIKGKVMDISVILLIEPTEARLTENLHVSNCATTKKIMSPIRETLNFSVIDTSKTNP